MSSSEVTPAVLSDEEETITEDEFDSDSYDDSDSTFESSIGSASYTASVTSGIKQYTYENGRRYHAYRAGEYMLPNDEEEQDRMDLVHHIYGLLLGGGLYRAPITTDIRRVLDLGTGTGIWAMDFADAHPSAQVLGNDLSPIQPAWTPPNCHFEVDDYESPWSYSPNKKFDLIHGRELEGMVSSPQVLFSKAYEHLNPGGWLEMQSIELDFYCDDDEDLDTFQNDTSNRSGGKAKADSCADVGTGAGRHKDKKKGPNVRKAKHCLHWRDKHYEAANKFGKSMDTVEKWDDDMRKAGLVNVKKDTYKLPFAPWPKEPKLREVGRYHQLHMYHGINSYTVAPFTRMLGWTAADCEDLMGKVRGEIRDASMHLYTKVHFVYGQKPVDAAN